MRLVLCDCSIDYSGRLTAHLPPSRRLIVVKADGTVLVHADVGSKALNWMSPPCYIEEREDGWTILGRGERLEVRIEKIVWETRLDLGEEPGLQKTGSESELQALLAGAPGAVGEGLELVTREYPTDLGPVDLLLRDREGRSVAVEVKRIAEIDAVEQLARYLERLNRDPFLAPVRGILVAQTVKPQARVLAQARGIGWLELDFDVLAGRAQAGLTLF